MRFIGPNDITVVILTYKYTDLALDTALKLNKLVNTVIITSDGGPKLDDRSDLPDNVKFIWQPDVGNRAATARNNGLAQVRTNGIVMFDDDCIPHPYCIQAHGLALNMHEVSYGLVCQEKWNINSDARMGLFIRDRTYLWRFGWTGNMAMRSDVYDKVVSHYDKNKQPRFGFDPLYNGAGGFDDMDYAYACYKADVGTFLNPLAMVHHINNHTVSGIKELSEADNYKKFVKKWGVTP